MTEPNWKAIAEQAVEALRLWVNNGLHSGPITGSSRLAIAAYEAATHKPDAAERAMTRIYDPKYHAHIRMGETWNSWGAKIIREEYARDLAERDARDKEREEAVMHFHDVAGKIIGLRAGSGYSAVCSRLARAFGWEK